MTETVTIPFLKVIVSVIPFLKVIVTVKSRGFLQIGFRPLIINYICNFLI